MLPPQLQDIQKRYQDVESGVGVVNPRLSQWSSSSTATPFIAKSLPSPAAINTTPSY